MSNIPEGIGSKEKSIEVSDLDFFYGESQALFKVNFDACPKEVVALIGPSGCGKSTFLRIMNRMNDLIPGTRVEGKVLVENKNIFDPTTDLTALRKNVGMVFQKSNPFPKSIYENVAYGPKIHGLANNKNHLDEIVEKALTRAGLWAEVKDRLNDSGTGLSGGQQ